jgi:hypothetical protein
MFSISMDRRPLVQLENDLDRFGTQALPYAVRDALNNAAYKTADLARKNANRKFQMRNQFTARSIQFEKTFARRIDQMESRAGSLQEYMREQEEGFTKHAKGKHGVPVPTGAAAGQEGARVRTRPIRRSNWMNRLRVSKHIRGQYSNTKQAVLRRVQEAVESGDRVIFLGVRGKKNRSYVKGFYRVLGGRKVKRGWPTGARLQLLYRAEASSVTTIATHWLGPPSKIVASKMDDLYRQALIRQIERNRLFRSRR